MFQAERLQTVTAGEPRALWYAIVSRLFFAAPDADFLHALRTAAEDPAASDDGALLRRWHTLQQVSREADVAALACEFDALFADASESPVTPYTSSYREASERLQLELLERLRAFGLARRERAFESEDHVSALCDTMRWLIAEGRTFEEQRRFFGDFVDPGVRLFCEAIERSPLASFYKRVAELTRALMVVEQRALEMHLPA